MSTAYRGAILHCLDQTQTQILAPGLLFVDDGGTITGLARETDVRPNDLKGVRMIDFGDHLILPGLVDAHLHIPQIDIIGIESENLLDWLTNHIFQEEMANEDPFIARDRAQRCFRQLLRSGTTACAAFSSVHTLATEIALQEARRSGIRAIIGKVLMNREAPTELLEETAIALSDTERLHRRWSGAADGRLDVAVTPRFGISCTDDLLEGAGKLAQSLGASVHTHLSENKGELEFIAKLFPGARDYTDVYGKVGLLGQRSIMAHCIHLSDGELGRLAEAGASAVYCPDSNFFLHSGRFPIHRCQDHGVNMALGSDVGAGTSFSLFEAMKMGNYMQTGQVDPKLLFHLATLGGARALGWQDRIGNLLPGKAADFIVIDPRDILRGLPVSEWQLEELLSILIHRGHQARIDRVLVQGRVVSES